MEHLPVTRSIETERLELKELTPELWKHMLTYMTDEEIGNSLGLYTPEKIALEKEKLLGGGMTNYRISFKNYLMREKASGKVIGKIGYHTWVPAHSRAEIGYAIDIEAYKNKGYMGEAMKAVLTDGFEYMHLHRVEALVGPENIPSLKLVERFGFKREGVLRQHYYTSEQYHDSVCYGLLASEYEKLKSGW